MAPDAIADEALLQVSRWQRAAVTPQEEANELLAVWQRRRILPPALRLIDCPPLAQLNDNTSEQAFEAGELAKVRDIFEEKV